jgi:hypothetical protein
MTTPRYPRKTKKGHRFPHKTIYWPLGKKPVNYPQRS